MNESRAIRLCLKHHDPVGFEFLVKKYRREASVKIEAVSFVEPEDEVLEQLWKIPYSRMTRNSGLLLVLGGVLLLIIYGIFEFLKKRRGSSCPENRSGCRSHRLCYTAAFGYQRAYSDL